MQDQPVEDGSLDASDDDKLRGLVEQVKRDVEFGSVPPDEERDVLQQRAAEAGLHVESSRLEELLS